MTASTGRRAGSPVAPGRQVTRHRRQRRSMRSRRYRFLETVRQYARERLLQSGEAERLRDRHLAFFLDLARRAEPELTQSGSGRWLNRLQREHDNLRSALEWCLAAPERGEQRLEFAAALFWFWMKRGYFREGQQWLERALAAGSDAPPALRAKALMGLGSMMFFQGDFVRTRALLEESATLGAGRRRFVRRRVLLGMSRDGGAGARRHRRVRTNRHRRAGRGACERNSVGAGSVSCRVSRTRPCTRATSTAPAGCTRKRWSCLAGRERNGAWGSSLFDLALLRVVQQRHAEARALCAEGIALYQEFGDRRGIAWCLGILSGAEAADGHALRAARLRGAMEGLLESVGAPVQASYNGWIGDRYLDAMKACLGDSVFEAALAEGRAMSLSRAIQFGLEDTAV